MVTTTVSLEGMSAVLHAFAEEAGAAPDRQLVVVLDGAGWHTADRLKVPPHVHLIVQPPYSPEVQPAEQLWPLLNEDLANVSPR